MMRKRTDISSILAIGAAAALGLLAAGTGHAQGSTPMTEMTTLVAKQCGIESWQLALRREGSTVRVERSPTLAPAKVKCIDDALRAMKVKRADDSSVR